METVFMNTENINKFIYQFTDKLNLKNPNKNISLINLNIYSTWKKIKSVYNDNEFKISAPTWNYQFDLLDRSYSFLNIQDYFEYITKKT